MFETTKSWLAVTCVVIGFGASCEAGTSQCVWGSFDASRINYASGPLTGGSNSTLQTIVTTNGGTLAAPTPLLTPAYLAGVTVFYTSLLSTSTGTLSAAEQAALQGWIASGGTLIVTGDIFPLPAYESFTAAYNITNYTSISNNQTGSPVAVHPITQGVNLYKYNTNCGFTFGTDGMLLGNDGSGNDFMAVFEPGTGFGVGGRILVIGDHNMFTESTINQNDNAVLAANIVKWSCLGGTSGHCPGVFASWGTYGTGWPGTNGVPAVSASNAPLMGGQLGVQVGNSLGAPTTAYMLLGFSQANLPTPQGGTILVGFIPALVLPLPLGPSGAVLAANIPVDTAFCGVDLYMQFIEIDPGAPGGASFTKGLRLTFG